LTASNKHEIEIATPFTAIQPPDNPKLHGLQRNDMTPHTVPPKSKFGTTANMNRHTFKPVFKNSRQQGQPQPFFITLQHNPAKYLPIYLSEFL
jgi:hypothetical protein